MKWDRIIGQECVKKDLLQSISEKRISHAQLFLGEEGYGGLALALAYAQEILKNENPSAAEKVEHFNHLDVHFSFPVFSDKGNSLSQQHFLKFKNCIQENPYTSLEGWTDFLDSGNKQFFISVDEIESLQEKFSLKSFEGGSKILIIWRADKMNEKAANKLLKFLEEPPEKTFIFLTAPSLDSFLPTILSRVQIVDIPRIKEEAIFNYLINKLDKNPETAKSIVFSAQGNMQTVFSLLHENGVQSEFEALLIQWVRFAIQVKKKPYFLIDIIKWASQIADWNREKQKDFLSYCAEIFRQAMLQNYGLQEMVYKKLNVQNFKWEVFSQYIHGMNIQNILDELTDADYHLTRNGNARIIWTDLGIKMSRFIHYKSA